MAEPEQQGADRDGDRVQDPVAVTCRDSDEREREGSQQLENGGGIDGPFDALGFRSARAPTEFGGDPQGVAEHDQGESYTRGS